MHPLVVNREYDFGRCLGLSLFKAEPLLAYIKLNFTEKSIAAEIVITFLSCAPTILFLFGPDIAFIAICWIQIILSLIPIFFFFDRQLLRELLGEFDVWMNMISVIVGYFSLAACLSWNTKSICFAILQTFYAILNTFADALPPHARTIRMYKSTMW